MSSVTRRALRVYSSLSGLKATNEDILDALIPFLEPILAVMSGKIFDPGLLATGVRRLYKWRFTRDIAEQFIPRLLRKGYLKRNGDAKSGVYAVTFEAQKEEADQTISQALDAIIDRFEAFPPRVTNLLSYSRTREELIDILVRFLVSIDAYRDGSFTGLDVPALQSGSEELLVSLRDGDTALSDEDRYMCARFVKELSKTEPEFIPHLTKLASIGLLTEVVEDFVKPVTAATKTDLTVVIDAPLALDYLGCSGTALQDDVKSIFESIKAIGGTFVVFPITCDEITRNLKSMLSLPPHRRHGYTHEAMIKREVMPDYVNSVANDPEKALNRIGVTVRPLDRKQLPSSHVYFDDERYEDFFASVRWVNDVRPREHDATCMALIMRLRGGKNSSDLFRSGYILVTRNPTFARESRAYCLESRLIRPNQEGPVVHQRELATLAWLRTGLGADEKIPRGHLLGTCERVLRVRPELTSAVGEKLREVTTPEKLEQFELLLLDSRSVRKLADQTLNDESVVTTENAERLFEIMRAATVEEERGVFERQMAAAKEKFKKERQNIKATHLEVISQRDAAQAALAERKASDNKRLLEIISKQNSRIKVLEKSIVAMLLLLGVVGVIQYFTSWLTDSKIWNAVTTISGGLGLYYFYTNLFEKPKVGLSTLLNFLARRLVVKSLATAGLSDGIDVENLEINAGQIQRPRIIVS